ncbi:MAG TPA: LacI family DNA-binding transcriptional regulator [Cellulomonas sp.]
MARSTVRRTAAGPGTRRGHRVTQSDVARLAGVSQAVVSMVLTGGADTDRRMTEATRVRVLEAIEQTGYVANPMAQRLAGGRTSIIGVYTYEPVFPHSAGDFYHPFLEGLEGEAQRSGVDLLLFTSFPPQEDGRRLGTTGLRRLQVTDACVLLGRHSFPEDLDALLREDYPFAFIGRRTSPSGTVPYAGAAYNAATREVTEHLIGLGHRGIALVTEYTDHESVEDRDRGYRQAMVAHGLVPVIYEAPDVRAGGVLEAFAAHGITAAVVTSDLAAQMRLAAVERGVRVPEDLSIARLGDPERADPDGPEWTGFTIPRTRMGAEALRIVLRQLAGETRDLLQVDIPCEVVVGGTSAPPPPPAG